MTAAPAPERLNKPHTGLDELHHLLMTPPPPASSALWALLHRAYPGASRELAKPYSALCTSCVFRDDLTERDISRVTLAWRHHATDILQDLGRGLMSAPRTLRALSAHAANAIHPDERGALTASVTRRLLVLGFVPNQLVERRITDDAVAAIGEALANLEP